ncbi:Protein of unknown function (DUF3048) [Saccharomonospora marina XMU15]|uniref:DUF3048 domain-containing protein n=1 Tax=Saccharomonospora marina XMU15 TaxID=882083 RepID=H5X2M9_9PSEU|nr:DUF3048 domain-containing protein [Saccharomonospora marina]EHR50968.1 Protein of unknown function (DUF3048) [Saccharomonospora marina XMU15]
MRARAIRRLLAAVAVFLAVGAAVAALLLFGGDEQRPAAPPPSRPPSTTSAPTSTPPPRDSVLVVKIDNVSAARPQTGLAAAEVVYVEPVEGGLTRLAAVYSGRLPAVAGPVRSARETDAELLAQYGHPTLAFSGAAPEIMDALRAAPLNVVTELSHPGAYYRDPGRPRPHNLYTRPAELPMGTGAGPNRVLRFGVAPAGGRAMTEHTVSYRAASYHLRWSAQQRRWLVSLDGSPLISSGAGQVGAATVVIQHVRVEPGRGVRDSTGSLSPFARTVGTGRVTVLRDGLAFEGTWSRPTAAEGTRFTTNDGEPLRLAKGPVWVFLVGS